MSDFSRIPAPYSRCCGILLSVVLWTAQEEEADRGNMYSENNGGGGDLEEGSSCHIPFCLRWLALSGRGLLKVAGLLGREPPPSSNEILQSVNRTSVSTPKGVSHLVGDSRCHCCRSREPQLLASTLLRTLELSLMLGIANELNFASF